MIESNPYNIQKKNQKSINEKPTSFAPLQQSHVYASVVCCYRRARVRSPFSPVNSLGGVHLLYCVNAEPTDAVYTIHCTLYTTPPHHITGRTTRYVAVPIRVHRPRHRLYNAITRCLLGGGGVGFRWVRLGVWVVRV